jgi:hypothetical protein
VKEQSKYKSLKWDVAGRKTRYVKARFMLIGPSLYWLKNIGIN